MHVLSDEALPATPWRWLLLLALSVGLWDAQGCSQATPPGAHPSGDAREDSVLAALSALRQEAFRRAYAALDDYSHTSYTRTEQLNPDHTLLAFEEQVVQYEKLGKTRRGHLLRSDAGGTFRIGFLQAFAASSEALVPPANPVPYLLPDDPPYLSPRNREAFTYRFEPDTSLWDRPVQVIEVRARPGAGDAQNLRSVRLFIDRASRELVGVTLQRTEHTLLFQESSRFAVSLRPLTSGRWVPHTAQHQTLLGVLLRPKQRFRTVRAYYRYEPAGPS